MGSSAVVAALDCGGFRLGNGAAVGRAAGTDGACVTGSFCIVRVKIVVPIKAHTAVDYYYLINVKLIVIA